MADAEEGSAVPAPPAKRSLFKKSAWAKPAETESDEALQLFSRSKEIFSNVIAEKERKRLERQAKVDEARRNAHSERSSAAERDGKRRRISNEPGSTEFSSDNESITDSVGRSRNSKATAPARTQTQGRSKPSPSKVTTEVSAAPSPPARSSRNRSRRASPAKSTVIFLSDSDDDLKPSHQIKRVAAVSLEDYDDDFEDTVGAKAKASVTEDIVPPEAEEEEYPELVARARENARLRMLERLDPRRARSESETRSDDGSPGSEENGSLSKVSASPIPDPVIQIFVTANIEGTNPLILKRKLSQRMKDVRMAWCDRQRINDEPMSAATKSMIFLTWRGHRVFDVSTGRSLGLKVRPDGTLEINGEGFDDGRVHLEAWTEDTFKQHKELLEAERKKQSQDPLAEEELLPQSQVTNEEPRLKIILKAREYPEFKINVKSTTLISKMIDAFRKNRSVPPEKHISLRFDGDELDPDSPVGDADMEDLTTVDVHISG